MFSEVFLREKNAWLSSSESLRKKINKFDNNSYKEMNRFWAQKKLLKKYILLNWRRSIIKWNWSVGAMEWAVRVSSRLVGELYHRLVKWDTSSNKSMRIPSRFRPKHANGCAVKEKSRGKCRLGKKIWFILTSRPISAFKTQRGAFWARQADSAIRHRPVLRAVICCVADVDIIHKCFVR